MAYPTPITVLAIAARAAAGVGAAVDLGTDNGARLHLDVSAMAGTSSPKLSVTIETSRDSVTWSTAGTFADMGATGSTDLAVVTQRFIRASWSITGTGPSFTFSIAGDSLTVFATPTELGDYGISPEQLANIDPSRIARILIGCSVGAVTDLQSSGRVTPPIVSWGLDVTMAVAKIAAWEIMTTVIGHNPDDPNNFVWRDRAKEGRDWLESVVRGMRFPIGLVDSTPTVEETGTEIYSEPLRGW